LRDYAITINQEARAVASGVVYADTAHESAYLPSNAGIVIVITGKWHRARPLNGQYAPLWGFLKPIYIQNVEKPPTDTATPAQLPPQRGKQTYLDAFRFEPDSFQIKQRYLIDPLLLFQTWS